MNCTTNVLKYPLQHGHSKNMLNRLVMKSNLIKTFVARLLSLCIKALNVVYQGVLECVSTIFQNVALNFIFFNFSNTQSS